MATELRTIPTTEITQTRFFGGQDRGTMLQLTVHDRGSFQSVSITREQAARVAQELLLFANGNEVPDFVETS